MKDDECWLKAAISDDRLVAELLLRLKDSDSDSDSWGLRQPLLPPWGLRQPRSKSTAEKKTETRRSPTTPLSWTGGAASPSECYDDSSTHHHHPPPQPCDRFRSKISASTETPTISSKRARRKKTFTELKEEESSLLKESAFLKKELATLHVTLKEQRSINENLKRMKLDLREQSGTKSKANSVQPEEERDTSHNRALCKPACSTVMRGAQSEDTLTWQEDIFVLPDLNMMPEEAMVGIMS